MQGYQLSQLSHTMGCLARVFDVVGVVEVEEELKAFQLDHRYYSYHRQYLDVQQFLSVFSIKNGSQNNGRDKDIKKDDSSRCSCNTSCTT